jgi:antirestriction protein ArdC
MNKVYQIVTDQILEKLEAGTVPWHKPWAVAHGGKARNLVSKKAYRGINCFLLAFSGFNSNHWLTFNQCKKLGGKIKKGSKSTIVVFWKPTEKEVKNPDTGKVEIERHFILRYYRVFNADQCEGLEKHLPKPEKPVKKPKFNEIQSCEKTVKAMPKKPEITHGGNAAFYSPASDTIGMPPKPTFNKCEEYYSTLFHELTHSTGHRDRLNRSYVTDCQPFGSTNYSKEELIAEMGAAFLCAEHGIENKTIDNSAAYIKGWVRKFKDKPKMVVEAAGKAQKAADFILDRKHND